MAPPEARLGFWALAYLVTLHRTSNTALATEKADDALLDFELKEQEIIHADQTPT